MSEPYVPSRYLCVFWGQRRLGVKVEARSGYHKKVRRKKSFAIFSSYLPMRPRAPQPNPKSSLTLKIHVNSVSNKMLPV